MTCTSRVSTPSPKKQLNEFTLTPRQQLIAFIHHQSNQIFFVRDTDGEHFLPYRYRVWWLMVGLGCLGWLGWMKLIKSCLELVWINFVVFFFGDDMHSIGHRPDYCYYCAG